MINTEAENRGEVSIELRGELLGASREGLVERAEVDRTYIFDAARRVRNAPLHGIVRQEVALAVACREEIQPAKVSETEGKPAWVSGRLRVAVGSGV